MYNMQNIRDIITVPLLTENIDTACKIHHVKANCYKTIIFNSGIYWYL